MLGLWVGQYPKCNYFALEIPTSWYPKSLMRPTRTPCAPNANPLGLNTKPGGPNTSQWNIVRVGYARVGFALFVSFFSRWVEYGLKKSVVISRDKKLFYQMYNVQLYSPVLVVYP